MKAFVLMSFAPENDDLFKLGIKEAAKSNDVIAYRLDEELEMRKPLDL